MALRLHDGSVEGDWHSSLKRNNRVQVRVPNAQVEDDSLKEGKVGEESFVFFFAIFPVAETDRKACARSICTKQTGNDDPSVLFVNC